MPSSKSDARWPSALLCLVMALFMWSGLWPRDRLTWVLEVFPVILAVPLLVATFGRFRFSGLAYGLMALHATILIVGGHWTYAENPLFNWLRDALHLHRNHYDRLGHLAQGFVPAILAREVLIRTSPLRPGKWLACLVVAVCLAISALYELIEWASAVMLGQGADQFLGTQGDSWDTQWDMFMALVGATMALTLLSRFHDRSMRRQALAAT